MNTVSDSEVIGCETRIVNCWPAFSTLLVGDWVVRMADGYSARANSASAIRPAAGLTPQSLGAIEAIYRSKNQPTIFRISPLASPSAEDLLFVRGYRQTVTSIGMIGDVSAGHARHPSVRVEESVSAAFIDGVSSHQGPGKRDAAAFARIVSLIALDRGCFTIGLDGRDVGYGLGVIDRGYLEISSVVLAPEARGRGLGRSLMHAMFAWALEKGATKVFLQVEASNTVARQLYGSLGMTELYEYRHYEKRA